MQSKLHNYNIRAEGLGQSPTCSLVGTSVSMNLYGLEDPIGFLGVSCAPRMELGILALNINLSCVGENKLPFSVLCI